MSHFCRHYATKAMHPSPEKGIEDKNPPRSDTQIIRKKQVWHFCHDPPAVSLAFVPGCCFSSLPRACSSWVHGALKEAPNGPPPGRVGPLRSLRGSRSFLLVRPVFCQRPSCLAPPPAATLLYPWKRFVSADFPLLNRPTVLTPPAPPCQLGPPHSHSSCVDSFARCPFRLPLFMSSNFPAL